MRLFIPACGDRLTLTAPWEFGLVLERRNLKFAQAHKLIEEKDVTSRWWGIFEGQPHRSPYRQVRMTLPAGTTLECDRIYIRTFNKSAVKVENDYDSITWKVMKGDKPARNQRFWVKLPDCYSIDYELAPDSLYRDRVKVFKAVLEA